METLRAQRGAFRQGFWPKKQHAQADVTDVIALLLRMPRPNPSSVALISHPGRPL
jgi:hypothetical protein